MSTKATYEVHPRENFYFALLTIGVAINYLLLIPSTFFAFFSMQHKLFFPIHGHALSTYQILLIFVFIFNLFLFIRITGSVINFFFVASLLFFAFSHKDHTYLCVSGILFFCCFIFYMVSPIRIVGSIKSNAVRVSEKQRPDIYKILCTQAKMLGLKKVPQLYILEGRSLLNAFAFKNQIIIYARILELAEVQGGIEAVKFIIGHELGHIKMDHTSRFKASIFVLGNGLLLPFLANAYSRAREYTCDSIGHYLAPQGAQKGLLALTVGGKISKDINIEEYLKTTQKDRSFATWVATIFSSHPSLPDRIRRLSKP